MRLQSKPRLFFTSGIPVAAEVLQAPGWLPPPLVWTQEAPPSSSDRGECLATSLLSGQQNELVTPPVPRAGCQVLTSSGAGAGCWKELRQIHLLLSPSPHRRPGAHGCAQKVPFLCLAYTCFSHLISSEAEKKQGVCPTFSPSLGLVASVSRTHLDPLGSNALGDLQLVNYRPSPIKTKNKSTPCVRMD